MGKKTIETFIYDGMCDYYLRIPLTQPPGNGPKDYSPQYWITKYFPKSDYTIRQVLDIRMEMVKDAEAKGLRKFRPPKGAKSDANGFTYRIKDSRFFEQEEREGKYAKYEKE